MNRKWTVCLIVMVVVAAVVSSTWGAGKLHGTVAYALKQIGPRLDKVEKLLVQGNPRSAKAYFETAQTQWEGIHRDFKGKFDENHPDIVAMKKRFEVVGAKLKAAGVATEEKEPATPTEDKGDSKAKAPPAAMVYVMKQIHRGLDEAQEAAAAKNLRQAKISVERAEERWKSQREWNVGKYDPQHPDVVALTAKLNKVKASVAELGGRAAKAAENLPAVLAAITESSQKLAEAHDKAYAGLRTLSSVMRDGDVDKLRAQMEKARVLVERVNTLLPDARAAAQGFRKQFPDFRVLEKLVRDGRRAGQAVERLEKFPANWLRECNYFVKEALDGAGKNIKMFGLDRLKVLEGKDGARKTNAADSAEEHVVEYADALLEIIPVVFPELRKQDQSWLPEFVKAREDAMKRAAPMRADIKKVAAAVGKSRKEMVDAKRRRLERARFPKSQYRGGKWRDAERSIRLAWAQMRDITDKQLLKTAIYSPWEVRTQARRRNNRWILGTYRYIGVNCLARLRSGKYMVYRMTFRNAKLPNGTWGPLRQWSVGHVYEILKENIDK